VKDLGLGGLVNTAAWLEHVAGMELSYLGRPVNSINDCVLEITGTQLLVHVALRGSWIWVSASSLDSGEAPEALFNIGDTKAGWVEVRKFLHILERSGITSLSPRPIKLGPGGTRDSYVID
jgi:hypothetical protein